MSNRLVLAAAAAAGAFLMASCGSRVGPLYSDGEQRQLLPGEIRMTTDWAAASKQPPDVRLILCRGNRITVELDSPRGRFEGTATEEEWNDLWRKLGDAAPWGTKALSVNPDDPTGGPYHRVYMVAGGRVKEFSSQQRVDLLIFTSQDVAERIRLTNIIVDFVAAHATNKVREGPAAMPASAPAGEGGRSP